MYTSELEALQSIQETYVTMNDPESLDESVNEKFAHPNHKKLDANDNGKVDAQDFALLRKKKGMKNFKEFKESLEDLYEVLSPDKGAGEYVKDFKKSDAPQFAGKSKEKRTQMGIAAFLAAKKKQ